MGRPMGRVKPQKRPMFIGLGTAGRVKAPGRHPPLEEPLAAMRRLPCHRRDGIQRAAFFVLTARLCDQTFLHGARLRDDLAAGCFDAPTLKALARLRLSPKLAARVDRLAGKVSAEEVRGMNYAVDSEHRDVGDVVREFRRGKGL